MKIRRELALVTTCALALGGCAAPKAEKARPLPEAQFLKVDCANPDTRMAVARGLDQAAGTVIIRHLGLGQEHHIHAGNGEFATTLEARPYPAGTQFAALGDPFTPDTWAAIRAGEPEPLRHDPGWHNAAGAVTAICVNYDPQAALFGITVPVAAAVWQAS